MNAPIRTHEGHAGFRNECAISNAHSTDQPVPHGVLYGAVLTVKPSVSRVFNAYTRARRRSKGGDA